MTRRPRISTLRIALNLIRFHLIGWKQVPGYTVVNPEASGDVYIAIQLRPPGRE